MNLAFLDVTTPMDPRHFPNKLHIGEHIRSIICKMITERSNLKYHISGTLLVVQWLRICQQMQATWVRSLVQEDTTCCRAVKPTHHHYWAVSLEPASCSYWSPQGPESILQNKRSYHSEKLSTVTREWSSLAATRESPGSSEDPAGAINK